MCNPGYVAQNGACVPTISTNSFVCSSYSPLTLNPITHQLTLADGSNIPAQDASGKGTCYYYAIYNGAALTGSSYLTGTDAAHHDQSVVARDHDADPSDPESVWHPYSMNHTNLNFTMLGSRTLHLTGGSVSKSSFTSSTINIDNFFLVGVYPQSATLSPSNLVSYYSAWGTGDSTIANPNGGATNAVAFNPAGIDLTTNVSTKYTGGTSTPYSNVGLVTTSDYAMIPLNVEASGGTAKVPSVDLSNLINANVPTSLDFRALDCGGSRNLGNIYLLIQ
jgi:hypothetical protein